jgi:hypothetical protein
LLSLIHVVEWRAAVILARNFAGKLPRNATGKIRESVLREPFWAGQDRRVS